MRQINAAVLAMCVAAGAGLAVGVVGQKLSETDYHEFISESDLIKANADVENIKPSYILGEKDGRVAVYLYGGKEPEIVFNVYLHHLPDVDRLSLQNGIEIDDYQTLLDLIEDYTS